jgi:PAS domain S-box-containing protein
MKDQSLRVLIVEDSEVYASLIIRELKKGGYNPVYKRVETAAAMKKALKEKQWDIILCDYSLPKFNAPSAIALLKESNIDIPLIVVTGAIGEETAAECMRLGAQDYIMKGNLSRLCPAISRELEDVEARAQRKRAEETIQKSEMRYSFLFDNMMNGLAYCRIVFDQGRPTDVIYLEVNRAFETLTGLKNVIGKKLSEVLPSIQELDPELFEIYGRVSLTGKPEKFEFYSKALKQWLSLSVYSPQKEYFVAIFDIITKHKQDESARVASLKALLESEERYKALFNRSLNLIYVMDFDGHFIDANNATLNLFGYKREEIRSVNVNSLVDEDQLPLILEIIREIKETGIQKELREIRLRHKDGRDIYVEAQGSTVMSKGKSVAIQVIAHDTTERKRAEETLRQSEEKYRTILEDIQEGYFEVDFAGNFIFFNDSLRRFLSYSKEELMGMNNRQYTDKENSKKLFQVFNKVYNTGEPTEGFDWQIIRKDGTKRYVEASVSLQKNSSGKPIGFRGIVRDITDRKKAEQELQESEKYFKEITENSSDIIIITDKNGKIKYCSPSVERFTGYKSEELIGRNGISIIHPDDVKRALSDYSKAILAMDSAIPNSFRIVRKDCAERYFEGLGKNLLDNPAVAGFIMNVRDVTERKQTDEELKQTLESLRKAVVATVQVMVSAIEMRDPYTAGHQLRVADLALTIATEMGLPSDKIDGIRTVGSIHDIGKLSIPAEILVKSTKLTNNEFNLIKEHPKSGYEMLKDVESPWPLAQIVYQHHERMNGSGYPRNLKGDEIIMEARILAVADVVEAMASHRPYRPTLGIKAALEEIEKNKGILYDDTVADACLRLFREKGYQLT